MDSPQSPLPLIDTHGRTHTSLRVSVTDRCNIRCFYCMPDENIRFRPRAEILTFEEIIRFVRVMTGIGVNKVRITGGEPLVRAELPALIHGLKQLGGLREIALTTNGILLEEQAEALHAAGLDRLNVSLDTLQEETFRAISRRDGLDRVLAGLRAAKELGFPRIRLNAIAIAGLTEAEVVPLAHFARQHEFELRFIEFMPLDADQQWCADAVLTGRAILELLRAEFGELLPAPRADRSQPASDFCFADGQGRIGFINSVSEPFCETCNRLRITAEGKIRNCLFSSDEWDARAILRSDGSDDDLIQLVRSAIRAKRRGHGSDDIAFVRPERAMYQIGG